MATGAKVSANGRSNRGQNLPGKSILGKRTGRALAGPQGANSVGRTGLGTLYMGDMSAHPGKKAVKAMVKKYGVPGSGHGVGQPSKVAKNPTKTKPGSYGSKTSKPTEKRKANSSASSIAAKSSAFKAGLGGQKLTGTGVKTSASVKSRNRNFPVGPGQKPTSKGVTRPITRKTSFPGY